MATPDSGLRVALKDIHPSLDGEYPLNPEEFTIRDINDLYRLAGVLPADFSEQFEKQNIALVLALAVISLRKGGKTVNKDVEDLLWDAQLGNISLVGEQVEEAAEDLPPASPLPNDTRSLIGGGDGSDAASAPSGPTSTTDSASSDDLLSVTGTAV